MTDQSHCDRWYAAADSFLSGSIAVDDLHRIAMELHVERSALDDLFAMRQTLTLLESAVTNIGVDDADGAAQATQIELKLPSMIQTLLGGEDLDDRPVTTFAAGDHGIETHRFNLTDGVTDAWHRKGENKGWEPLVVLLGTCRSRADSALADMLARDATYQRAVGRVRCERPDLFERAVSQTVSVPDRLRILCRRTAQSEAVQELLRKLGYELRFYADDAQVQSHRYFCNESGFCLYVRGSDGCEAHGVVGNDQSTVARLRSLFEDEWREAQV